MQRPPGSPADPRKSAAGSARSAIRKTAAGAAFLGPLLALLWFTYYMFLPDNLNGMPFKPFVTAGTIDRIVKIGTIVFALTVISSQWSVARRMFQKLNPGLVACMVLIPLSAIWSIDSAATILRFITQIGLVLLCIAIALAGWDPRRFQKSTIPPLLFILVLSLLIGIVSPGSVKEIGTDLSLNNSWKGITFQKNQFGSMSSIAAIIFLNRLLAPARASPWVAVGFATALLCVALSRSSTSLLATVTGSFFMVLVMRVPVIKARLSGHAATAVFCVILLYALAVQNLIPGVYTLLKPVLGLTGKDMTLSARTVIWNIIKDHIQYAPWLGSGYGAYWAEESPRSPSYIFTYVMSFYPGTAHNGYLEMVNDLGRVGLACLMVFLIFFVRQGLALMRYDQPQGALYLALLFQQMVVNLSESEWFSRGTTCTMLILASVCLSRALSEYRMQARPQAPTMPASGGARGAARHPMRGRPALR